MARSARISITTQQYAFLRELSGASNAYDGLKILIEHHRAVAGEIQSRVVQARKLEAKCERLESDLTAANQKSERRRQDRDDARKKAISRLNRLIFWRTNFWVAWFVALGLAGILAWSIWL